MSGFIGDIGENFDGIQNGFRVENMLIKEPIVSADSPETNAQSGAHYSEI
jgi:hypothetical protein